MKIVKEHINEKFEEKSDPIQDMGIGGVNLGRIRTQLKKEYRKKTLKTYKDLIYKKTISGKFNEMGIIDSTNNTILNGRGWGNYTIFVDMIFDEPNIDEDSVSFSVLDSKKGASYIIPITDEKIFIKG